MVVVELKFANVGLNLQRHFWMIWEKNRDHPNFILSTGSTVMAVMHLLIAGGPTGILKELINVGIMLTIQ